MPISKQQKQTILNELKDIVGKSKSLVFINFKGLKVKDAMKVRRALLKEDVKFTVAKKSLLNLALDGSKVGGTKPELPGEVAFAYGSDLIAPARGIHSFSKELKDALKIIGGIFDGSYKNQVDMMAIATIPPVKTLHAMVAFSVKSPLQKLVIGLNAIAAKKESAPKA